MRYTIQIRPAMHFIGSGPDSGKPAPAIQGYAVEFFRAGVFVESRVYTFGDVDERTMVRRIASWITDGTL